jgi:4,5-DOPA dioxygenase extradiol
MDRRTALKLLLASPLAAAGGRALAGGPKLQAPNRRSHHDQMPSIFLAHGSPLLLDDAGWVAELAGWANELPRPSAVLMLSAHWLEAPITLGATQTVPLVYDFYGFPDRYYQVKYPAPGAPALARRVTELLAPTGPIMQIADRGLDHGAYVPLVAMYPQADVPVLQISIPTLEPPELLEIGHLLAPLRREGVLIVGSGFLSHNLRSIDWSGKAPTPAWAKEFDHWIGDVLARRDIDALLDYRKRAPALDLALPTHEHFVPVVTALGAAADAPVTFPITGFMKGSGLTRRSAQFG